MDWSMISIGFALAVFTGAVAVTLLGQHREGWTRRRRVIVAASVLPAVTVIATLIGLLFVLTADHGGTQTMEDLAVRALLVLGLGFALLALAGGLIGAGLAGRHRK